MSVQCSATKSNGDPCVYKSNGDDGVCGVHRHRGSRLVQRGIASLTIRVNKFRASYANACELVKQNAEHSEAVRLELARLVSGDVYDEVVRIEKERNIAMLFNIARINATFLKYKRKYEEERRRLADMGFNYKYDGTRFVEYIQ